MEAENIILLYYSSITQLSRGYDLSRTFDLRQEIYIFLKEEGHKNANDFADADFLMKLEHLRNIFDELNALNLFLQEKLYTV